MVSQTSAYFPLATEGSGGEDNSNSPDNVDIGASGDSSMNSISLSTGGLVAIVVVVVLVIIVGITTATLFFIAKKREWTVRETIRRSARKVVTAMTPRRSQFPDSVRSQMDSSKQTTKRHRGHELSDRGSSLEDLEKGPTNPRFRSS